MGSSKRTESRERIPESLLLILTAVLLGLIAVLTAWTGYQAARWGGIATNFVLQSNAARGQSSVASLTANELALLDIQIFIEWVDATLVGDTERANFYQQRMRDEAKPAFDAWLATDPFTNVDAPDSPFAMPQYVLQKRIESQQLADQAAAFFEQYKEASQKSLDFVLTAVILASALFFTGLSSRIKRRQIEAILIGLSIMLLVYGVVRIIILQIS
jgi:hypothetical protein